MDLLYFFSPDRPVALVLNIVIVGALAGGALTVVWALLKLRAENSALDVVAAADPATAEQANAVVSGLAVKTVVRDQLELLQAMKRKARAVKEESLIGIAEDTLHHRIATPLFLRSTLVLLGLAGTLWGLSLAITDLSGILGDSAPTVGAMKVAILGTLSGMETAFSTTLAGVAGAVLLSFMTRWYEGSASRFLKRLEEVNLMLLIPLYDTSESSVLDLATQRLEQLTSTLEGRLDQLLDRLDSRGDELTQEVERAVDQFVTTFADRSRELLEEISQIRERTIAIFGTPEEGQKSLVEQVEGFTSGIEELQTTTHQVRQLIPELSRAMTAAIEEQKVALEEVLSAESLEVKKLNELHESWGASLTGAIEQLASSQAKFVDQSSQLAAAAREFNESWGRIERSLGGTEKEISRSMETLRDEIRKTLHQVSDSYQETHSAVLDALGRFEKALAETNAAIAAEPRRAVRQSSELLDELDRVVRSVLPELAQTMAKAGTAGSAKVESALRELTREIRSLPGSDGRPAPRSQQTDSEQGNSPVLEAGSGIDPDTLEDLKKLYPDEISGHQEEGT